MDFRYQLRHRFPAQVKCDLRSNVQIHSRNKKVSSGTNQLRYIAEALFGIVSGHVAEKVTREHHVLRPESVYKFRISGIQKPPRDPFPQPGLNRSLVAFPIKYSNHLSLGQPFKNRSTDRLGGVGSVNAFLGEAQYFFRDIHRIQ
jgi:hypothetical protein